jgi:hypothetical protein
VSRIFTCKTHVALLCYFGLEYVLVGRFLAIMKVDKLNMDVPSSADFYL